jgi:hypothetical protein
MISKRREWKTKPDSTSHPTHMSPGSANPGSKERAIAEVARSYGGAILCPDELSTIDPWPYDESPCG